MCLWLCDFDYCCDDFDLFLYLLSYWEGWQSWDVPVLYLECCHHHCRSYSAIIDLLSSYYLDSMDQNYWQFLHRHQIHYWTSHHCTVVESLTNNFVAYWIMVLLLMCDSFADNSFHGLDLIVDSLSFCNHRLRMDLLQTIEWFLLGYYQAYCCRSPNPKMIALTLLRLNRKLVVASTAAWSFSLGCVSWIRCYDAAYLKD